MFERLLAVIFDERMPILHQIDLNTYSFTDLQCMQFQQELFRTFTKTTYRPLSKRTTKAERKRRREAALVKISDGYGFANTVPYVMPEWGCSRSTARRDVHWAHGELQLNLDAHDVQHLVTHVCTSLPQSPVRANASRTCTRGKAHPLPGTSWQPFRGRRS